MTTTIRLARLHLVSRRVPASLVALAVVAVALRVALRWTPASGASSVVFPLIMAAAAATVISATTHSPLGEPERVTGAWLPWLRFGSAVIMAGAACGALALGAVGGHLALGAPALLRDLAGLTGIALITAALLGAGLGWTGPLACLVDGGAASGPGLCGRTRRLHRRGAAGGPDQGRPTATVRALLEPRHGRGRLGQRIAGPPCRVRRSSGTSVRGGPSGTTSGHRDAALGRRQVSRDRGEPAAVPGHRVGRTLPGAERGLTAVSAAPARQPGSW